MLLYYITDRTQFGETEATRRSCVLAQIRRATEARVDFIQLREKDLPARELEQLSGEAVKIMRESSHAQRPRLLVNSRVDVAIAAGADGVHLRSNDLPASEARTILMKAGVPRPVVAVSCHTLEEIAAAEAHGADFAVFGPVFGKGVQPGIGLEQLRMVCNRASADKPRMPVLALGGVTIENAVQCLQAGAAGIAAIRLFQNENIIEVVQRLRNVTAHL